MLVMTDIHESNDEGVCKALDRIAIAIYDVALVSLDSRPLWMVLNFIYSSTTNAIAIMPDGHDLKKQEINQYCIENMLIVSLLGEQDVGLAESLLADLCRKGFSSERRAVLCAEHYCEWLRSRGKVSLVSDAIARIDGHVKHSYFKMELQAVEKRYLGKEEREASAPVENQP